MPKGRTRTRNFGPVVVEEHTHRRREEVFLPSIDGPKIGPFRRPGLRSLSNLRFESLLNESSSSGGGEAYVFKASYLDETYAVKVFRFWDIEDGKSSFSEDMLRRIPSDKHLVENMDPFYAECRAYGRINEIYTKLYRGNDAQDLKEKQLLAVPCHGYIFITAEDEKELISKFGPMDFERDAEQHDEQPLRAIVKKFVPPPSLDRKARSIRKMLSDLRKLHEHGVYPIDIHEENYRKGMLVDFGRAITTPSCILDAIPEDIANRERGRGLGEFDKMIERLGIRTTVRAAPIFYRKNRTRHSRENNPVGDLVSLVSERGGKVATRVVEPGRWSL